MIIEMIFRNNGHCWCFYTYMCLCVYFTQTMSIFSKIICLII